MSYFLTKERNKKRECVTFIFDPLVKSFLQSTLHGSCFIFISFSPQSISFVSPTTVHLGYIYLIWLYSYSDIHYLNLNTGGFTTPCLFILNKKYNSLKIRLHFTLPLRRKKHSNSNSTFLYFIILWEGCFMNFCDLWDFSFGYRAQKKNLEITGKKLFLGLQISNACFYLFEC